MNSPTALEIKVSYRCRRRCRFCVFANLASLEPLSLDEARDNVAFFREHHGIDEVVISGGEPTEWEAFPDLLQAVKAIGVRSTYLHTNAGPQFHRHLRDYIQRLDRVMISYHGIGGHWACSDSCLAELVQAHVRVRTNTLMLRANHHTLTDIVEHLGDLGIRNMLLTYPFPLGGTALPTDDTVERLETIEDIIAIAVQAGQRRNIDLRFQGIPMCILRPYSHLQDPWIDRYLVDKQHQFDARFRVFDGLLGRQFYEACDECQKRGQCNGGWPPSWHTTVFTPTPFHDELDG